MANSDSPAAARECVSDEIPAAYCERTLSLIATIVGRGRSSTASYALSRRLLRRFGSAAALTGASHQELLRSGKVSERQALVLRACLELGRSICSAPLRPGERFSNSRDLFNRYRARYFGEGREHFVALHLNAKNQLIREVLVSIGSLSSSVVHPREVFSAAVRDGTAGLIVVHNHPSGDPSPSREDRDCTRRLCRSGRILGIRLLDHIIIGREDYFSFADSGQLGEEE